ncbi:exonuclease domain-containing protein [Echinimonas agarilytica]|uniref:Exonuclease domain-containing protein n=1 Tax=Echinimonas agarilytica TaxID=1215918 RepID=A0AA42B867_9GAMM|nr:exonuclease domain-containing protein [Echinimonas agarilytica]MCM2680063.1 exonuclease domain-containing protein [Echinimonas agarilytica]
MIEQLWRQWRLSRMIAAIEPHLLNSTQINDYVAGIQRITQLLNTRTIGNADLLALDLELTGLNPATHAIVSLGYVSITQLAINLQSAHQQIVKIDGSVGDSAVIHHLTDHDLKAAKTLEQAMNELIVEMTGKVLVCHHAPLDIAFLKRAFIRCYGTPLPLLVIDTQFIERQTQQRTNPAIPLHRLRLHHCRENYNLPPVSGHQALADAIGCAELLLAQQASKTNDTRLSDITRLT